MNAPARIRVTTDHIAKGKRNQSSRCPIAYAIAEQTGYSLDDVAVGPDEASILNFETWLKTRLPLTAYWFIQTFDACGPAAVTPVEFDVEWIRQDGVAA